MAVPRLRGNLGGRTLRSGQDRGLTSWVERLRKRPRQGNVSSMPADSRTELRALALWHTRRRAVDELLTPLLEYGPVAVDRVTDRLDDLAHLVAEEADAFQAFVALVGERNSHDAVVLDLFARTARPEAAE